MQTEGHTAQKTINRYRSFRYELILEGILTGAIAGSVVVFFRYLLSYGDELLRWVLNAVKGKPLLAVIWFLALTAGALFVALMLKWESLISGSGIPQVEGEMIGELDPCWWKTLLAKLAGGLVSLGFGLSLGREGPSIQLGAMTAKGISRISKRSKTEEKLLITCGASAGLSAAFNAPIAGVLFSLEEIHKHFSPEILLSTMASSITADFVSRNVFGLKPIFDLQITKMIPLHHYGYVIAFGVIIGVMGVVYNTTLSKTQDLYQKIPNQFVRLMIPFLLAGVFGLYYPAVLGGGHSLIEVLTSGEMMFGALCVLLFLKFAFSILSFGSGAPGGIFLPLLVLGAVIGSLYCSAVGMMTDSLQYLLGNFIILGMAGYFSAIVRAPITGIILISEMTGSFTHLLALSLVSLIAYVIPDMVRCAPVYDQLLHRLLRKLNPGRETSLTGEKVLVEGMIFHGSEAEGKKVSEIQWPRTCLLISLLRGEAEFVPRGETKFLAGDKMVILCDESAQGKLHEVLLNVCETVKMESVIRSHS